MIELRAFGNFAYKVSDAGLFLKEIAGTDEARAQKVKSYYDVFKQAIGVS
jgi:membrane protease subunit (stomatin/prohibitin family)